MSNHKNHVNEFLKTGFANSGRVAGIGTPYDRYGEESGGRNYDVGSVRVILPSDYLTPEEQQLLSGEVITYRKEKTLQK